MALITCPECKQQISDQATSCPNCGYPLAQSGDPLGCTPQNTEPEPMASTTVIAKPAKKKRAVAIIGVTLAGGGIPGIDYADLTCILILS